MTPPYCMRTHLRRSTRRATVCRLAAFVLVGLWGASGLSRGQTVEVITSLVRAPNGRQPRAGLIQSNDGNFYGTTSGGGASSLGTLFKVDASGTLTTLHSFTGSDGAYPSAGLIQASDGSFYGTTSDGGASWNGDLFPEGGTVFKLDAAGTLTTLHSFTGIDGRWPLVGLIQARDGSFYGTTSSGGTSERCGDFGCGTVFKIDAAGTLTTLHSFTGTYPGDDGGPSVLIQASDGSFYGTTGATVFKMDAAGTLTTLHRFTGFDGAGANGLIQASDGNFYGTTLAGGYWFGFDGIGYGTVFKIDATGTFTILHSFAGSDGQWPSAGLIHASDGNFYGTTFYGGASWNSGVSWGYGTVFEVDTAGTVTTLHSFSGSDGQWPSAGLIQAGDGNFYGTTSSGGASGLGTVFKIDATGTLTTLHSFSGSGGAQPYAGLIQASDGNFYGTTSGDVALGYGTVFKIDATGTPTTLHSFSGSDGAQPYAGLIQASDGNFYGTTSGGGASGYGTVFKIDGAGTLMTLHSFTGIDGAHAALIQGSDGNFYGTTFGGGASFFGTVFKIDATGTLTTLHSFTGSDGEYPNAGLIQASDGTFYGTTSAAGASGGGTVFKVDGAGTLTTLHNFTGGSDGASPRASLVQASDGSFYGTTVGGGGTSERCPSGCGTVFKLDATGTLTTLHSFSGSDGAQPYAGLIQASDGSFYGTTQSGGAANAGVVFRLRVSDTTPPAAGPVTPYNTESGSLVDTPFDLTASFTDNESPVTRCEYTTNGGSTWNPATVSGSSPTFTCTQTGITGTTGQVLTLNMRATSGGGTGTGTAITRTVDQAPVAKGRNATVPAGSSCTANASVDDGSFDPDGDPITISQSPPGPYPLGETPVTLTVTDSKRISSQWTGNVTAVDAALPQVTCGASKTTLWPPNHHLIDVGFSYAAKDNCDANPATSISVTSDEPVVSSPDAAFIEDAAGKITGLKLRAERKGDGDGRVYLIKLTTTDKAGNSASMCSAVTVPHDHSAASRSRAAAQAAAAVAACEPLANNAMAGVDTSPASKGK